MLSAYGGFAPGLHGHGGSVPGPVEDPLIPCKKSYGRPWIETRR